MGWKDDLQDASFRGVHFECTSTSDAVAKSLAIKQPPYSNKAQIEDMGNDPRKISINAVYMGEDYLTWLKALEAALITSGSGELIHPIYGIQQVYTVNYSIGHSAENPNYCSISIEFINAEDRKRELFTPVFAPNEIESIDVIDQSASALESALEKLKIADNSRFFNVVNNIQNGVNTARQYLNLAQTNIEDILSPAEWAVDLVDDITKLATFDITIPAISKWRDLAKRIQRLEKVFHNEDSPVELQQFWRATQIAATLSITQEIISNIKTEMVEGNEVSLTPIDLAVIRQHNRQLLQAAINSEREQDTTNLILSPVSQIKIYREVADQLHLQIQELIEIRPPLSTTKIITSCTLHWLAHQLYGDFSRASEIRRLNPNLQNPALLKKGMELTVYAR